MIIREATLHDDQDLLRLGKLMHAESPRFSQFSFDDAKTLALIHNLIQMQRGIVIVAEHNGKIVGMMGGAVIEHFFSKDLFVCDFVVYIDKDHRGGSAVVKMIKKFESKAIDLGAKEVSLGISTELFTERTKALYEKLGYKCSGISTIKRIQ